MTIGDWAVTAVRFVATTGSDYTSDICLDDVSIQDAGDPSSEPSPLPTYHPNPAQVLFPSYHPALRPSRLPSGSPTLRQTPGPTPVPLPLGIHITAPGAFAVVPTGSSLQITWTTTEVYDYGRVNLDLYRRSALSFVTTLPKSYPSNSTAKCEPCADHRPRRLTSGVEGFFW